MILDVYSRKIVGVTVGAEESMQTSAALIEQTCAREGVAPDTLVLHSDNGAPMKGCTMLAMLESLGAPASFSRPRVSDDNPYSESLFRTMKYRPSYPHKPFVSLEEARAWVESFVDWYNDEHLHSGVKYVTPNVRHAGSDKALLAHRHSVYTKARARNPTRWSRQIRNWEPVTEVWLNQATAQARAAA
jgi:putative transposase